MSASDGASEIPDSGTLATDRVFTSSGLISLYAKRMELVAMSQRAMNGDLAESYVTVPFGRPLVEPLVNDVNPPVDGTQPIESPWEALRRRLSAPAGTPQGKLATT